MAEQDEEHAIARLAAGQRGLIMATAAYELGMTRSELRARVTRGQWIMVERGLYRFSGAPHDWHQRLLAACILGGPGAVASHRSAAALWRFDRFKQGKLEVTFPSGRSGRLAGRLARVHHTEHLGAEDRSITEGIPLTGVCRTVVNLAGVVSPEDLVKLVDDVIGGGKASPDGIERALGRTGRTEAGRTRLRIVLEAWARGRQPESPAEAEVLRAISGAGFPQPVCQYEVWADGEFLGRLDVAWPKYRLGLELQSFRWHNSPRSFARDKVRFLRLYGLGWQVLEVTPAMLKDDDGAMLRQALSEAFSPAPAHSAHPPP